MWGPNGIFVNMPKCSRVCYMHGTLHEKTWMRGGAGWWVSTKNEYMHLKKLLTEAVYGV